MIAEKKKYSKTSTKAKNEWNQRNYDRIAVQFPKGRRDELKQIAKSEGRSMNEFIRNAVDEHLKRNGIK